MCFHFQASTAYGVHTLDVAKRLLDYGYHPPTIYFPMIVNEAIMIEPTETETKETLDGFIKAPWKRLRTKLPRLLNWYTLRLTTR
jgi:glycine dehydrogenase subunit 2